MLHCIATDVHSLLIPSTLTLHAALHCYRRT